MVYILECVNVPFEVWNIYEITIVFQNCLFVDDLNSLTIFLNGAKLFKWFTQTTIFIITFPIGHMSRGKKKKEKKQRKTRQNLEFPELSALAFCMNILSPKNLYFEMAMPYD